MKKNTTLISNKLSYLQFTKQYLYIRTKNNLVNNFTLNAEQKYIYQQTIAQFKSVSNNRILVLKPRQIGSTTFFCSYSFYKTFLHSGLKTFVLSHRQSSTNNLFDIILRFYTKLPEDNQVKALITRNKSIVFSQQDSAYNFATAGSKEVGRGDTIQFFHGSEVAFWPNASNHIASVLSAVPTKNSHVFLESTSAGPSGAFYDLCMDAISNKNGYKLIFIPWFWHKDYSTKNNNINVLDLPKDWLEYKNTYGLSSNQLIWAYNQNSMLSLNNQNNSPSNVFFKEYPASVQEAFKYSNNNNLIQASDLQNQALDKNFSSVLHNNKYDLFCEQLKSQPIILGVDMAYGGEDSCYIIDRMGSFIGFNVNTKINTKNTMHIVGLIKQYVEKFNCTNIFIDVAGGGVGVCDRLAEIGIYANKVHFASAPTNKQKFVNIRAEMWYAVKNFIQNNGFIINDSWILHQLSNVGFFYTSSGQIQLQSKDEIKKLLKYSPDAGDAIALTFAKEIYANKIIKTVTNHNGNLYNPLNF